MSNNAHVLINGLESLAIAMRLLAGVRQNHYLVG